MAEEIKLILNIEGKGSTRTKGDIKDITKMLDDMRKAPMGVSPYSKRAISELKKELISLQEIAKATGRVLKSVDVKVPTTKGGKLSFAPSFGSAQAEIAREARRKRAELQRQHQEEMKLKIEQAKERRHFENKLERAEREQRMNARIMAAKAERQLEKQLSEQKKAEDKKLREEEKKAQEKVRQEMIRKQQKEQERKQVIRSLAATSGFLGLNLAHQMSGMLDGINFGGMFSGALNKAFGAIGGLFGTFFRTIGAEVGNILGTVFEIAANTILNTMRGVLKAVGGIFSGIFTSLITISFSGWNLVLGVFAGILMAITQVVKTVFEAIVDIVKGVFQILASIVKIGMTIIEGIFTTFGNIITSLWNGIWEGLKSITTAVMDATTSLVKKGLEEISGGFQRYVDKQQLVTKASVQIADTFDKMGMSFQQGADLVEKNADKLRLEYAISSADALNASYVALSSGFTNIQDAFKVVEAGAKLGTIGFESTKNSVDAVVDVLNAYRKGADEAGKVSSEFYAITNVAKSSLHGLTSSVGNVINAASQSGLSFKELGAMFSYATLTGVNASRTMVGLNRVLQAILNPTKINAKTFAEMGINLEEVKKGGLTLEKLLGIMEKIPENKMREAFGTVQGVRVVQAILRDTAGVRSLYERINTLTGVYDQQLGNVQDTWGWQIKQIKETKDLISEGLVKQLTGLFVPALKIVNEMFKNMLGFVSKINFSAIGESLGKGIDKLWNTLKELPNYLDKSLGISERISGFWARLPGYVETFFNYISDPKLYEGMLKFFMKIPVVLTTVKNVISDGLFNPELMSKNLSIIFSGLFSILKSVGTFLYDVLSTAFDLAFKYFSALGGVEIEQFGRSLLSKITEAISTIFLQISSELSKGGLAAQQVGEVFGDVGRAVMGANFEKQAPNTPEYYKRAFARAQTEKSFAGLDTSIYSKMLPKINETKDARIARTAATQMENERKYTAGVLSSKNDVKLAEERAKRLEDIVARKTASNVFSSRELSSMFQETMRKNLSYEESKKEFSNIFMKNPKMGEIMASAGTSDIGKIFDDILKAANKNNQEDIYAATKEKSMKEFAIARDTASEKMSNSVQDFSSAVTETMRKVKYDLIDANESNIVDMKKSFKEIDESLTFNLPTENVVPEVMKDALSLPPEAPILDTGWSMEQPKVPSKPILVNGKPWVSSGKGNYAWSAGGPTAPSTPTTSGAAATANYISYLTKYVPIGQSKSIIAEMQRQNPNAKVEMAGTINTKGGLMAAIRTSLPENIMPTFGKKDQTKEERMLDNSQKHLEKVDVTNQKLDNLQKSLDSIDKKTVPIDRNSAAAANLRAADMRSDTVDAAMIE